MSINLDGAQQEADKQKGDVNNTTLRAITIKQALDASQPYPEANYQIDGADAASIVFIGQVRNISTQTTNVTYKIDDGTGEIEVKQWIDSSTAADTMETDDGKGPGEPGKDQIVLNAYVKVFGRLRAFVNKRFVSAHCVRPLENINELHCHLLESAAVHLFFARGPPGGAGAGAGTGPAGGGTDATMGGADDYDAQNKGLPAMSPLARRVFNLLKNEFQSNEGWHMQMMATKLNLPMTEIQRALDELISAGLIYSTVDEYTWAVLDYYG